jgi:hypothetical protein
MMNTTTDPNQNNTDSKEQKSNAKQETPSREKQQQGDPNITELKGLTDPDEDLEPKDTDNDTSLT